MGTSLRAADLAGDARTPGRYHGWRRRWSVWQRRSMVAAAVVHGVVFLVWPVWHLTYDPPPEPLEMIQFQPMATVAGLSTPEGVPAAPTEALEVEEEVAVDEEAGIEVESDEELLELMGMMEVMDGIRPTVIDPLLNEREPERPEPPFTGKMVLDLQSIEARLAKSPEVTAWPLIRNPTAVVHYLRREFNPLYRDRPGPSGLVSVAMFVNEVGVVEWAAVRESSGYPALDEIALTMIEDVVLFRPVRGAGGRVPVTVVMEIPFTSPW